MTLKEAHAAMAAAGLRERLVSQTDNGWYVKGVVGGENLASRHTRLEDAVEMICRNATFERTARGVRSLQI